MSEQPPLNQLKRLKAQQLKTLYIFLVLIQAHSWQSELSEAPPLSKAHQIERPAASVHFCPRQVCFRNKNTLWLGYKLAILAFRLINVPTVGANFHRCVCYILIKCSYFSISSQHFFFFLVSQNCPFAYSHMWVCTCVCVHVLALLRSPAQSGALPGGRSAFLQRLIGPRWVTADTCLSHIEQLTWKLMFHVSDHLSLLECREAAEVRRGI